MDLNPRAKIGVGWAEGGRVAALDQLEPALAEPAERGQRQPAAQLGTECRHGAQDRR